jgi:hypothetical protein
LTICPHGKGAAEIARKLAADKLGAVREKKQAARLKRLAEAEE